MKASEGFLKFSGIFARICRKMRNRVLSIDEAKEDKVSRVPIRAQVPAEMTLGVGKGMTAPDGFLNCSGIFGRM